MEQEVNSFSVSYFLKLISITSLAGSFGTN